MAQYYYGQLQSEKTAEENRVAREIVKEIGNFGINERQRWMVIHMLAMELENVDDLKALTSFIKDRKGENVFLTGKETIDGTIDN
jgi:hypothetical protein